MRSGQRAGSRERTGLGPVSAQPVSAFGGGRCSEKVCVQEARGSAFPDTCLTRSVVSSEARGAVCPPGVRREGSDRTHGTVWLRRGSAVSTSRIAGTASRLAAGVPGLLTVRASRTNRVSRTNRLRGGGWGPGGGGRGGAALGRSRDGENEPASRQPPRAQEKRGCPKSRLPAGATAARVVHVTSAPRRVRRAKGVGVRLEVSWWSPAASCVSGGGGARGPDATCLVLSAHCRLGAAPGASPDPGLRR